VFSGAGEAVAPELVLPVFVVVVLFFALLVAYPWVVLTTGTVLYLASLPFGVLSYRGYERKTAVAAQPGASQPAPAPVERESPSVSPGRPPSEHPTDPERPTRLN
jgi:CDP-diacylglycerol--serine O-phosphatidyltransferase